MAKNLINSVSFTVLLVALLMASTGILESEALPGVSCGIGGCLTAASRVFLAECPTAHNTNDNDCCTCCKALPITVPPTPPVCWAVIEGGDNHCHCYTKRV